MREKRINACDKQNLSEKDEGDPPDEFCMLCFVTEYLHTEQHARTAAKYTEQKERTLRNAPTAAAGSAFICTADEKCQQVDNNCVKEK